MNKNVKFWHSLKVKPGFLILLINLKTEATQWRKGGKGAQTYGRRENVVREAGDSKPPCPPPLLINAYDLQLLAVSFPPLFD